MYAIHANNADNNKTKIIIMNINQPHIEVMVVERHSARFDTKDEFDRILLCAVFAYACSSLLFFVNQ